MLSVQDSKVTNGTPRLEFVLACLELERSSSELLLHSPLGPETSTVPVQLDRRLPIRFIVHRSPPTTNVGCHVYSIF